MLDRCHDPDGYVCFLRRTVAQGQERVVHSLSMKLSSLCSTLALALVACNSGSNAASHSTSPPASTREPPTEEQSAGIFMIHDGFARRILGCFHPSQKSRAVAIHSAVFDKPLRTIQATLFMEGYTGSYYMHVTVELDFSTHRMRVTPKGEDTMFAANPSCALRDWTAFDDVDDAADAAKSAHRVNVAVGVSAVISLLSRSDAERRAPPCLAKALLDEAVDDAVKSTLSSTAQRAVVTGAIKQAYSDTPSASGIAKEALSYAVVAKVREYSPRLGDALDVASLANCLMGAG